METESVAPIRTAPDLISKHSGGVQTLTYMHTRGQMCLHTTGGWENSVTCESEKEDEERRKKLKKPEHRVDEGRVQRKEDETSCQRRKLAAD